MSEPPPRPAWWRREEARWTSHLAALVALGVGRPLFEVLGEEGTFFVAHRSSALDVLLLAAAVGLLLPLIVALPALALGLARPRAAAVARAATIGALALPLASVALRGLALPAWAHLGLALAAAAVAGVTYARAEPARSFATALSPAVLIVPALFLLSDGVRRATATGETPPRTTAPASGRRPLVLVVFDALPTTSLMKPDETLDAQRFPGFAELARESVWFRDATTVHDHTSQAVPAILTGLRPEGVERVPVVAEHPRNLFTLLGGAWDLVVHEEATALCPPGLLSARVEGAALLPRLRLLGHDAALAWLHVVTPAALAGGLPPIDRSWAGFGAVEGEEPRTAHLERFLRSLAPGARPAVHFLHVTLPHEPYVFLPSGRRYAVSDELPGLDPTARWGTWSQDAWAVTQAHQRHLLQLQHVDRQLARLIGRLRDVGAWDDAVVVVTADHGVSFVPGENRRTLTRANAADILSVPLFVKVPGGPRGAIDDGNAETIDVLPTIADALGVPVPWSVDGASLLRADPRRPTKRATSRTPLGPGEGSVLELPAGLAAGRRASAAARLQTLGDDLLSVGPVPALVGERVTGLQVDEGPFSVVLAEPGALEDVDPAGPRVPAFVTGWTDAGLPLAIAVNGVVRATTQAYADGRGRFAAIVPEDAFVAGPNHVEVLGVAGASAPARLLRPRGAGAWRLDGDALVLPDGARRTLTGSGGALETLERGARERVLSGWASAGTVVAFEGDALLAAVGPTRPRPDVVAATGRPELARSGFELRLPARALDARALRLVAVSADGAALLDASGVETFDRVLQEPERLARLLARCFARARPALRLDREQGWSALPAPTGAEVRAARAGGPLELAATSGSFARLRLAPPLAGWPAARPLLLRLELTAPRRGVVRLTWQGNGPAAPGDRATWAELPDGRAVVDLAVWTPDVVGPLWVEVDAGAGSYHVDAIEVRALE